MAEGLVCARQDLEYFGSVGAIAVRQLLVHYLSMSGSLKSGPLAIVGTAVAVLLAIGVASAAPARMAVRLDQVQALRED